MNIEIKVVHLALFYDEYKYISITIFLNRPLIGVSFCKLDIISKELIMCSCFRPLIGVNFCKPYDTGASTEVIMSMFPSPYRG